MWLNGCQHHHSLPRIDPPTALLLSALLCCIDVSPTDFHTHYSQIFVLFSAYTHTDIHTQHSALLFNSKSLAGTCKTLALLLYSSSPSWVVSHCLGQMNQLKLTSSCREKDRKVGIYGEGRLLIDQRVHLLNWFMWVCVYLCVCVCMSVLFFTCNFSSNYHVTCMGNLIHVTCYRQTCRNVSFWKRQKQRFFCVD